MASDARFLPVVRGTIGAMAAVIGWDESEYRAIVLALDEAVANTGATRPAEVTRHGISVSLIW